MQLYILPKHPHITKQIKTTTVQVKTNNIQGIPKWNSRFIEGIVSFIAVFTEVLLNPGFISSCHSPWVYKFTSYWIISKLNTGEAKGVEGDKQEVGASSGMETPRKAVKYKGQCY